MKFALSIGNVIPHPNGELIDTLIPSDGKSSSKGSFSNRFGFGAFPLHTDAAFWPTPTKQMILFSMLANDYDSLIYNSNNFLDYCY